MSVSATAFNLLNFLGKEIFLTTVYQAANKLWCCSQVPRLFIQPGHPHSQLRLTKAASCPGPYILQMKAETRIKHLWSRSLFLPLKSYFFKQIVQEKSSDWKQLTSLGYSNFCAEGSGSSRTFSGRKWWPITQRPANSTLSLCPDFTQPGSVLWWAWHTTSHNGLGKCFSHTSMHPITWRVCEKKLPGLSRDSDPTG